MAPPVTPSPHRFLSSSSKRRSEHERELEPHTQDRREFSSTQQFRPTPRFGHWTSTQPDAEQIDSPSASPANESAARRGATDRLEDRRHVFTHGSTIEDRDSVSDGFSPPPKRLRRAPASTPHAARETAHDLVVLSSSPLANRSPSISPVSEQVNQGPAELAVDDATSRISAPRFKLSKSQASQAALTPRIGGPDAPLLKTSKPGFVLPPRTQEPDKHNGLPATLSPYKIGGKSFVAGGLASMVRDWVLELETSPAVGGLDERQRKKLGIKAEIAKVCTIDSRPQSCGVWLGLSAEDSLWLLVGPKGYGRHDTTAVGASTEISIKPPMWNVPLDARIAHVAVRWAVATNDNGSSTTTP